VEWKPVLEEVRASDLPTLVVRPEPARPPASVALLSGSFDPVTIAHDAMAEAARDRAELVVLVYSVRTLPKEEGTAAPLLAESRRLALLDRLCEGREGLAVGVASHGLLAEQVEAAARRFPEAALSIVVGSDKLPQLFDRRWYDDRDATLDAMLARARVLFAVRAGDEERVRAAAVPERWRGRIEPLAVPSELTAISSSDVRMRLRAGEDIAGVVPEAVRPLLLQFLRGGS
jgi:nicotinate-nucleotide adenylyltransferase